MKIIVEDRINSVEKNVKRNHCYQEVITAQHNPVNLAKAFWKPRVPQHHGVLFDFEASCSRVGVQGTNHFPVRGITNFDTVNSPYDRTENFEQFSIAHLQMIHYDAPIFQ